MKRRPLIGLFSSPLHYLFLLLLLLANSIPTQPLAARAPAATYRVHLPLVSTPAQREQPTVGYATGTDRTLIRWFCTTDCNTLYQVQRRVNGGTYQAVATVGREANQAAAVATLNTTDARWPTLYETLLEEYQEVPVTDVASLYALLDQNALVAQKLSNEYYPVALINGWGYLDTDITPGTTYEYRVQRSADNTVVGTVKLIAGQITPLPAPTNVQALALNPGTSSLTHAKSANWGSVQADRRFHQQAYLRWDVSQPQANSYPLAWTIGYDIYRAPAATPDALVQVNGEISVQPIPASLPDMPTSELLLETAAAQDYQQIEHFYADATDDPGTYIYRVAPRDALGQVRQWPAHNAQFSSGVRVATHDFMPPPPPQDLQATGDATQTHVALAWSLPNPPADLAGFRIEHTLAFNNTTPPAECADAATCWVEVATVGANVFTWTDANSDREVVRWYRVQAVDGAGNRSMYSMPVQATLHDMQPPGKPTLRTFPCPGQTPGVPSGEICLEADGDGEVTRYLVGCTFDAGGQEIFLVDQAATGGDLPPFNITSLYEPPFPLQNVPCRVRAVDAHGNMSPPSEPANIGNWTSEQPAQLPAPILTDVSTIALDEQGNATAQVQWEMPASPLIQAFRITRERVTTVVGAPAQINGISRSARSYNDTAVRAGELYRYTVTALLNFGMGELSSEPQFYRVVSDGRRPLVRFDLANISWNANSGTLLNWNSCPPGSTIDGSVRYAVFRSIELNQGYTQITPVFPATACIASYTDSSAQHGRYFYSIVQFDIATGEPIGYTIPAQFDDSYSPQTGNNIAVPAGQGLVQSTLYNLGAQIFIPNCTPINPSANDFSQPLRFGDGFELHNLQVNLAEQSISGGGHVRVFSGNDQVDIPVTFSNITVADAQNRVCGGSVSVDVAAALGSPLEVTPADGLTYQVQELTLRPFFANISNGTGRVRVILPRTLRALDANGDETDTLNLAGPQLRINANLDWSFQTNLDQIADHGCAPGESPILGFSLETLPTIVVPAGTLRVTPAGIEASASCMDYAERYNPASTNGYARPAAGNLNVGDSNDGFLRGRYTGQANSLRITATGLAGSFSTAAPMSYLSSYPYGFSLQLNGNKQLTLEASQIASGSLGGGTASFNYRRSVTELPLQPVTVLFNNLTVDARGGLYATLTPDTSAVEWMLPNGFITGLLNSELYLGQVTSDQRPGQTISTLASSSLWATRPADSVDLNLEQPATLEPGLNLRRADHSFFWKGCPSGLTALPATVDSYIRRGGINERFQAQIDGSFSSEIHGYPTEMQAFDMAFLDNFIVDSDIRGEVALPFPADANVRFLSMWFNLQGCIGGGALLNGVETLEYWNTNVTFNHAVFREQPPSVVLQDYPNWKDQVLYIIGALELPHLALPNQPAPTLVGVEVPFRPDGNPEGEIKLALNRPDFEFDGFPLLLTGVRLSTLNEVGSWDANATAATPPPTNWSERGFVDVYGALAAPYFGLLVRESGASGEYPTIRMQLHEDYVGFDEQLKGSRVWVDLAVVQLTHDYRNLVYASSELEGHGLLLGFRQYQFIPQAGIDLLGLPESARVFHMDATVAIDPEDIEFFLGQSAGTAAFRAMAEAQGGANPPLPNDLTMSTWANQLGMSADVADGYQALAAGAWGSYSTVENPSFYHTTQVLNAYDLAPGAGLPDSEDFGGGTSGLLETAGMQLNKMRGNADVRGIGLDMQIEALEVASEVILQDYDEPRPVFEAQLLGLVITRHGDYLFEGANVQTFLTGNQLAFDINGIYSPSNGAVELGVTLHQDVDLHRFEMWNISLNDLTGAAAWGGEDVRYFGLNLDASWNFVPFKAGAFGGQALFGTINPASPILQAHFPDVLDHLHIVPAAPGSNQPTELLKGGYVRLYGDISQGDRRIAKVLTVNGGLRFGGWHWSNQAGGEYYGGLAGVFVHTNYLKVLSARGDITFGYEHTPTVDLLAADAWVAGGIGSCEPETWTSWGSRWWNDQWCWSAGARTELVYNLTDDDFDADWDLDFE